MNSAMGYGVTVLLWLAAVLQIAVLRDRTVFDSRNSAACRWCVVGGLLGLAGRFTYVLIDRGHLVVPWHSLVSIGLFALGLLGLALDKFKPLAFMDTQPSDTMDLDPLSKGP